MQSTIIIRFNEVSGLREGFKPYIRLLQGSVVQDEGRKRQVSLHAGVEKFLRR